MTETSPAAGPAAARKRKRDRSPSYPGIDLKEAVAKAIKLYAEEGRHKAPVDVVLDHWGYKPKSGAGMVALAALKKFGLLDDSGSGDARQAGLSKAGIAIADKDTDPDERQHLIRTAALAPSIHAELWRDYGEAGLPSDSNLRSKLKTERSFTEGGASEFISQFKETLGFAKLSKSGTMSEDATDKKVRLEDQIKLAAETVVTPPAAEEKLKAPAPVRTFNVPLSPAQSVIVQMPARMDERSWELWLSVMKAMKPGIVREDDSGAG